MPGTARLSGSGSLDCAGSIAPVRYVISLGGGGGGGAGAVAQGRLSGSMRDLVAALGAGPRILTLEGGGVLRVQVMRLDPARGEAQFVVLDAPG